MLDEMEQSASFPIPLVTIQDYNLQCVYLQEGRWASQRLRKKNLVLLPFIFKNLADLHYFFSNIIVQEL